MHILSLGTGKALAIGNVTITGELKTETSGIGELEMVTLGNAPVYSLQGVRVTNPKKGIYIQNGRKHVVR